MDEKAQKWQQERVSCGFEEKVWNSECNIPWGLSTYNNAEGV